MKGRDHDFDPQVLAARIVQGATEADAVRLHGAIAAALQLHPFTASDIFDAALREAAVAHGDRCVAAINDAVTQHIAGGPVAELRHCPYCGAQTVQESHPLGATRFVWGCTVCGRRTHLRDDP